jgi:AcrR family transcriptional regulator
MTRSQEYDARPDPLRRSDAAPDSTEGRIIAAAVRLFAERGIDAVSLRSIMAAAGTNIASIHYHFGSKEALVREAILARSAEIAERRAPLLDAAEGEPGPTARGVAHAFIAPIAELTATDADGAAWVRLIGTIMTTGHPSLEIVTEAFKPQGLRFRALIHELEPSWSRRTVLFRLSAAMRTTFITLGETGDQPAAALVEDLEGLVTSMLTPAS